MGVSGRSRSGTQGAQLLHPCGLPAGVDLGVTSHSPADCVTSGIASVEGACKLLSSSLSSPVFLVGPWLGHFIAQASVFPPGNELVFDLSQSS